MTETIFFRLLADEDKGTALANDIDQLAHGESVPAVYLANPASFEQIPGSPFAYWVSEDLRRKFTKLPPFESDGRTIKSGTGTLNDFRFLRLQWEVFPGRVTGNDTTARSSDFRRQTLHGRGWTPYAKGGAFSQYYYDYHLLVDWFDDGATMKAWVPQVYGGGHWSRNIRSTDFYFRPGLTWPRRTNGLSFRALPTGCIFADKGPAAFVEGDHATDLLCLAALMNSQGFFSFVQLMVARVSLAQSFEVGLIQSVPIPPISPLDSELLSVAARSAVDLKRDHDRASEISHTFCLPALLREGCQSLNERIAGWDQRVRATEAQLLGIQEEVDEAAYRLYGIRESDRKAIEIQTVQTADEELDRKTTEQDDEEFSEDQPVNVDPHALAGELVSYLLGAVFGRWDIRIALDPSLAPELHGPFEPLPVCSPGMLVGADGLPATSGRIVSEAWLRARPNVITLPPDGAVAEPVIADREYPLRVEWDGILVDDPDHADDLVRRVREALDLLWGERAEAIEREACEILGSRDLREYLSNPRRFFDAHLKRYSKSRRKAPIYWPLSTASGSYTLWLYYPRLTSDTLYTAVNKYVEPKLRDAARSRRDVETRLSEASGRPASQLRDELERLRNLQTELEDLRDELLRVAGLPFRPSLDDGVIINAAPLSGLFRHRGWAKATQECWQKLAQGDYDWAHLAYQIWPERVREKCRSDRSLAIAHGLDEDAEAGRRDGGERTQAALPGGTNG